MQGEGDRRWTLIRSGYLPEDIKRIKDMTKAMMDGLATKGYYEFENGNINFCLYMDKVS